MSRLGRRWEPPPPPTDRPWRAKARPSQLPPAGDWAIWMTMTGRGWGKTLTGSGWLHEQAMENPGLHFGVIAPTFQQVRDICVEGPTGILAAALPGEIAGYNRSLGELRLSNGSRIHAMSGDEPDRIRGHSFAAAWIDELASFNRPEDLWKAALVPAVRIPPAKICVTTTPRPTPLLRELNDRDDGSVVVTRGSVWENRDNLSPLALAELEARYAGTRLGRQELEGQLITEVEGALWTLDMIEQSRVSAAPDLVRVVVAIDPATTSGEHADETGVVVAGRDGNGHLYLLADRTCRVSPRDWAARAIASYDEFGGDRIVAEVNNGGDMVESVLRSIRSNVAYSKVTATRGKRIRAEPIAALYEQRRCHHVGVFDKLEDQLLTWAPDSGQSPDRLDACVWAMTELMDHSGAAAYLMGISWLCTRCDLPNGLKTPVCEHCGASRPAPPAARRTESQPAAATEAATPSRPSGPWACPNPDCRKVEPVTLTACRVCGTPRPAVDDPAAAWACSRGCATPNPPTAGRCTSCGADRQKRPQPAVAGTEAVPRGWDMRPSSRRRR